MTAAARPAAAMKPHVPTAERRIRRTQRTLATAAILRALLFAAVAVLGVVTATMLIDRIVPLPRDIRELVAPISFLAALVAGGAVLLSLRRVFSLRHVARWVEEREPRLEYGLLTILDPSTPPESRRVLEASVDSVRWEPMITRRLRAALGAPLAMLAILFALLLLWPSASRARVTAPAPGDALDARRAGGGDDSDPLSLFIATVTPPAYARRAALTVENPLSLGGLVGSTVTLRGRAATVLPSAAVDTSAISVRAEGGRWSATFRMPARPTAVRLRHRGTERLIVLEPVIDSAPVVSLARPAADTVLADPRGEAGFAATLHDDIGIVAGGIEYIVSSGSGETFSFRSGTLAPIAGANRTIIELSTRIILDSLKLAAGDIVHFRVFARDGNTVSGPSTGFSETRAIRIVRPDERDSVAVDAAPPPEADASLVSQRMLIILTEALQARRARLGRSDLVAESRRIAADQKKLRRTVGDIIFTRLGTEPDAEHVHGPGDVHDAGDMTPAELLRAAEQANRAGTRSDPLDFHGDESPVVAINRPLLEAYNHMWDASRELDIGEPGRALPPMRAALAAIQRARQAERIYLRGRAAPVIVDVTAARLQGKDTGTGSRRSPRVPLEHQRDLDRFTHAIGLLAAAPRQAMDSLMLLRVELIADRPSAAATLAESIELLSAGRDATAALGRARRALLGEPVVIPGLGRWGGGW